MEIGENVENTKNPQIQQLQQQHSQATLHTTQSQPIILGGREEEENIEDENGSARAESRKKPSSRGTKDRRVSFANSSQLAQFLEPLDPFQSFGM